MSVFETGYPAAQIDEEILRNMKTIDFVGYAPNPGNIRRNQVTRRKKHGYGRDVPKFRSEQERELLMSNNVSLEEGEPQVRDIQIGIIIAAEA